MSGCSRHRIEHRSAEGGVDRTPTRRPIDTQRAVQAAPRAPEGKPHGVVIGLLVLILHTPASAFALWATARPAAHCLCGGRSFEPSDLRTFGPSDLRTFGPSDLRYLSLLP